MLTPKQRKSNSPRFNADGITREDFDYNACKTITTELKVGDRFHTDNDDIATITMIYNDNTLLFELLKECDIKHSSVDTIEECIEKGFWKKVNKPKYKHKIGDKLSIDEWKYTIIKIDGSKEYPYLTKRNDGKEEWFDEWCLKDCTKIGESIPKSKYSVGEIVWHKTRKERLEIKKIHPERGEQYLVFSSKHNKEFYSEDFYLQPYIDEEKYFKIGDVVYHTKLNRTGTVTKVGTGAGKSDWLEVTWHDKQEGGHWLSGGFTKNWGINKFEEGKWYVFKQKKSPSGTTLSFIPKMEAILNGKPRKCVEGYGCDANFDGIEGSLVQDMWSWDDWMKDFMEVSKP